ncbi:hypothetical protein [Pseudomonas sp.]
MVQTDAEGARLIFDLAMMTVQAAIDGLGGIGRSNYVDDDF